MKRLLLIAAACAAAYYVYTEHSGPVGVYAEDGSPHTVLFTTADCGDPCTRMRRYLKTRVTFEEVDAFDGGNGRARYLEYGGNGFLPFVAMGRQRVIGPDRGGMISAIAAEFGTETLPRREQRALERNFDASGNALVVMYATSWCGYCKQAREYFAEHGINYVEFDIEADRSAKRDFDALLGTGTPLLYNGYARMSGFNPTLVSSQLNL